MNQARGVPLEETPDLRFIAPVAKGFSPVGAMLTGDDQSFQQSTLRLPGQRFHAEHRLEFGVEVFRS